MNGEHPNTPAPLSTEPETVPTQGSLHTPGPWRWEINLKSRVVRLTGGVRPLYDLTVMDFVRWGMGNAAPRFIDQDHLMERADTYAAVVPGREHHAQWFQGLSHPDAHLIAAAPDLLAALRAVVSVADRKTDEFDLAHSAIAKAEGRS